MITRIYADNYKCLVNMELSLSEVSLLVGLSGSGKSSVLGIIGAIRRLLSGTAKVSDEGVFPLSSRTRWQQRNKQVIELDAMLAGELFRYRLEVDHEPVERKSRIWKEVLTSNGKPLFVFDGGEVRLYRDDHSEGPAFPADWAESAFARLAPRKENTKATRFLEFIRRIVVCKLEPGAFEPESAGEDPSLAFDGSNFVSWYRHMSQEHQENVQGYLEASRRAVEGFQSIRLERVGAEARSFKVIVGEDAARHELRIDELSDGQRALLALYALIHLTKGDGATLFLDEPDNFVALPEIQPLLMELSDAAGEGLAQVVLCSHHPEVVDYLGDRGLLLERELNGGTRVRPLRDVASDDTLRLSEVISRGWER